MPYASGSTVRRAALGRTAFDTKESRPLRTPEWSRFHTSNIYCDPILKFGGRDKLPTWKLPTASPSPVHCRADAPRHGKGKKSRLLVGIAHADGKYQRSRQLREKRSVKRLLCQHRLRHDPEAPDRRAAQHGPARRVRHAAELHQREQRGLHHKPLRQLHQKPAEAPPKKGAAAQAAPPERRSVWASHVCGTKPDVRASPAGNGAAASAGASCAAHGHFFSHTRSRAQQANHTPQSANPAIRHSRTVIFSS